MIHAVTSPKHPDKIIIGILLLCTLLLLVAAPAAAQSIASPSPSSGFVGSSFEIGGMGPAAVSATAPLAVGSVVNPAQAQLNINPINEYTAIVWQAAEQNVDLTASTIKSFDVAGSGAPPWFLRLLGTFFTEIGHVLATWVHDFVSECIAPAAGSLVFVLQQEVLNPNVAAANIAGSGVDTISAQIRRLNVLMYSIAQDLLLLIFMLSIWKAWTHATWRSRTILMGPIVRFIFTAALLLAWPTICAFIIQISNEMIQAIYPASGSSDAVQLAKGLEGVIDLGIDASGAALIAILSPVAGAVAGSIIGSGLSAIGSGAGAIVGGLAGDSISFVAMLIFTILAAILIAQLVYIVIMKAMQTILLYAQYMFAPFFLLFFAHPDTETIATRYIRAVIEVSLWSFVWVGLLRILVIVMTSPLNIWGQCLLAIAVFQLMISVPEFLAHARISPVSDFISAGPLSTKSVTAIKDIRRQAKQAASKAGDYFADYHGSAARGGATTSENRSHRRRKSTLPSEGATTAMQEHAINQQDFTAPHHASNLFMDNLPNKQLPKRILPTENRFVSGQSNLTSTTHAESAPHLITDITTEFDSSTLGLPPNQAPDVNDATCNRQELDVDPLLTQQFTNAGRVRYTGITVISGEPAALDAKGSNGISISYGSQQNQIASNSIGGMHLYLRKGAAPSEISTMRTIAGFAKLIFNDPAAMNAATLSVSEAQQHDIHSLNKKPDINTQAATSRDLSNTLHVEQTPDSAAIKHAILGSHAYINGYSGNAFSAYLNEKFGNWHDQHIAEAAPQFQGFE